MAQAAIAFAQASLCLWSQQILLKHVISLRQHVQQREKLDRRGKKKTQTRNTHPHL